MKEINLILTEIIQNHTIPQKKPYLANSKLFLDLMHLVHFLWS